MADVQPEVGSSQIENEVARAPENETTNKADVDRDFIFKLKEILYCIVCKELRRTSIFQCKYGHLICAGCFEDILAESKTQNEIATCPECQSTISRESCSQNVAVEKTISELSSPCQYCWLKGVKGWLVAPHRQRMACEKRPSICCNNSIGCGWEGPHSKKFKHQEECKQLSANGHDIFQSLITMDQEVKKEVTLNEQIFKLLSVESFLYFDLQFKLVMTTVNAAAVMKFFESTKFTAFDHLFVLQGYFKEEISEFSYRLALKGNCKNKSLTFSYLLVKGPYSEIEIKPKVCQFAIEEKSSNSSFHTFPFHTLSLWYDTGLIKYHCFAKHKRINFRIFLFQNK